MIALLELWTVLNFGRRLRLATPVYVSVCTCRPVFLYLLQTRQFAYASYRRFHHSSWCCVPGYAPTWQHWCARGCVVECRICNWEVAGSHPSLGYFAPRSTQPSIPLGSVNEYQLRLGRQRQVWFIPIADERVGVQVKLWDPLRTRAILERFCSGDSLRRGAISS